MAYDLRPRSARRTLNLAILSRASTAPPRTSAQPTTPPSSSARESACGSDAAQSEAAPVQVASDGRRPLSTSDEGSQLNLEPAVSSKPAMSSEPALTHTTMSDTAAAKRADEHSVAEGVEKEKDQRDDDGEKAVALAFRLDRPDGRADQDLTLCFYRGWQDEKIQMKDKAWVHFFQQGKIEVEDGEDSRRLRPKEVVRMEVPKASGLSDWLARLVRVLAVAIVTSISAAATHRGLGDWIERRVGPVAYCAGAFGDDDLDQPRHRCEDIAQALLPASQAPLVPAPSGLAAGESHGQASFNVSVFPAVESVEQVPQSYARLLRPFTKNNFTASGTNEANNDTKKAEFHHPGTGNILRHMDNLNAELQTLCKLVPFADVHPSVQADCETLQHSVSRITKILSPGEIYGAFRNPSLGGGWWEQSKLYPLRVALAHVRRRERAEEPAAAPEWDPHDEGQVKQQARWRLDRDAELAQTWYEWATNWRRFYHRELAKEIDALAAELETTRWLFGYIVDQLEHTAPAGRVNQQNITVDEAGEYLAALRGTLRDVRGLEAAGLAPLFWFTDAAIKGLRQINRALTMMVDTAERIIIRNRFLTGDFISWEGWIYYLSYPILFTGWPARLWEMAYRVFVGGLQARVAGCGGWALSRCVSREPEMPSSTYGIAKALDDVDKRFRDSLIAVGVRIPEFSRHYETTPEWKTDRPDVEGPRTPRSAGKNPLGKEE